MRVAERPEMPKTRLIREGEGVFCARCHSGRHAHRQGGERGDHAFDGPPTLRERVMAWIHRVVA